MYAQTYNYIYTSIPYFQLCYPCECLAHYARSPIIIIIVIMTTFILKTWVSTMQNGCNIPFLISLFLFFLHFILSFMWFGWYDLSEIKVVGVIIVVGPSPSNHTLHNNKQTYSPDVCLYVSIYVSVPLLCTFKLGMTGRVTHTHCIFSNCVSPVGGECIKMSHPWFHSDPIKPGVH